MTGTAPKVFISYSHDSSEHEDRVLDLADRLRADGVYAEVDQYNTAPPEGWPLWCERQIEAADFVLMVCTESYHRRVTGAEQPGTGLGVVWEAGIIRQLLYDAGAVSNKFIPVLCSDASASDVPIMIRGRNWYVVDTEDGYERLYRFLSAQPDVARPPPGPLRPLPVRSRTLKSSLFLAPPRPYGYKIVGRDEIVQDIKNQLFSGRDSAICALNGLPGVGKTALAIELAHDPEIRARFKHRRSSLFSRRNNSWFDRIFNSGVFLYRDLGFP